MLFKYANRIKYTNRNYLKASFFLLFLFSGIFLLVGAKRSNKVLYRGFYSRIAISFLNLESEIKFNCYSRLVSYQSFKSIVPDIAYKWEVKKGGKLFIFYLRDKVYFHDGSLLRAEDVKKSLEYRLKRGSFLFPGNDVIVGESDFFKGKANEIKGIKCVSDRTLSIELQRNYPFFLRAIATLNFPIVKFKNGKIIGTGPYILKIKEKDNRAIIRKAVLIKFKKYFLDLKRAPEKIVIFDINKNYEKYTPDIFSVNSLDVENINYDLKKFDKYRAFDTFLHAILFNIRSYWGGNKNFRNFVGYGFNFRQLVKKLYGGSDTIHNIIPMSLPHSENIPSFPAHNYEKALACLKEIKNKSKKVKILTFPLMGRDKVADSLAKFLISHGFKVKEKIFLKGDLRKAVLSSDIIIAGFKDEEDIFNAEFFLFKSLNSEGRDNVFNYKNQYVEELTQKLVRGEVKDRNKVMKFILDILNEDMPVIPLTSSAIFFFVKKGITLSPPPCVPFLDYRTIVINEE